MMMTTTTKKKKMTRSSACVLCLPVLFLSGAIGSTEEWFGHDSTVVGRDSFWGQKQKRKEK